VQCLCQALIADAADRRAQIAVPLWAWATCGDHEGSQECGNKSAPPTSSAEQINPARIRLLDVPELCALSLLPQAGHPAPAAWMNPDGPVLLSR
jgi:hypothetical protein